MGAGRASPVSRHYTGDRGREYLEYQRAQELGFGLNARKFQPFVRPGDTVVDFGCAYGGILGRLEPAGALTLVGIEPNEHARAAAQKGGIEVVESTKELRDAFADLVISNHALEHTLGPWEELRELRRVLKPSGRLVLCVPLESWRAQRDLGRHDPNHHVYGWTPVQLRNLLDEAGFTVREVRVLTSAWPLPLSLWTRLPPRLFDAAAWICAVVLRRRQLLAVAD
jgi:SAM-dependent methyltransferase